MLEAAVKLIGVFKKFSNFEVVRDLNLEIYKGEIFSILGPSGSGKTTTLKLIAGLIFPDKGTIKLMENNCTFMPPYKRNIGMVFQDLALFPHLNVFENVAYGLRIRKLPENEIKERVYECLEIVNLEPKVYAKRKISQLSGGQQQRVAIARALAIKPSVLLFDEPLGSLDLKLRQKMINELRRIQRTVKTTFIYVTHDQSEAFMLSDRIAVMNNGRIEQVGTPMEVYENPRTMFVAEFIGEMNFLEGKVKDGCVVSEIGEIRASNLNGSERVVLAIRPEKIKILNGERLENVFEAVIEEINYLGSHIAVKVRIRDCYLKCLLPSNLALKEGQIVKLGWNTKDMLIFEA